MAQLFTPGLSRVASTVVRRRRELPVQGTILVERGSRVAGEQLIGRAELPGDLVIGRMAEKMGIEPEEAIRGLQVKVGDTVTEGQTLSVHLGLFGLFKTTFPSPATGIVELITERTGHIAIRLAPRTVTVDAYIPGTVVEVEQGKGVVIESRCTFIQGIFGVGGERQGSIEILPIGGGHRLGIDDLPSNLERKILVGGTRPTIEVLREAASRGAVGMVVGSIDDHALAAYLGYDLGVALTGDENVPMTVIVTEGFGELPLSEAVLELLRPLQGATASLNGATQVRAGAMRPELIIERGAHPEGVGAEHIEQRGLQLGSRVRIIRVPYFGLEGTIAGLPPELQRIPTGAFTRVAAITLADGRTVEVPRANLELA